MQVDKNTQYYYDIIKSAKTDEEINEVLAEIAHNKPEPPETVFNACMYENNITVKEILDNTFGMLSESVVYHYINGQRRPPRDKAIILILAAKFNLEQCDRYLKSLEYSPLRPIMRREGIIMKCVKSGIDPLTTNEILINDNERFLMDPNKINSDIIKSR